MSQFKEQIDFIMDFNPTNGVTSVETAAISLVKRSIEGTVVKVNPNSKEVTIMITPLSFDLIEGDVVRIIS
jgi:hypothetical protein